VKILYTCQRYGESIVGGSEAAARAFSEHLVRRGHEVEVVTSCAQSYVDWANVYEPGTEVLNGVTVHRLPVVELRRPEKFGPLHGWMINGPASPPLFEQQRWAKHMGPDLVDLPAWTARNIDRFDLAVFMTYMYSTTTRALPTAAGRIPTILQPTAHDEPSIWIKLYDTLFRLPDAYLFFTPEEREVVRDRFHIEPHGETIGIGIDLDLAASVPEFREAMGLGDAPYLLYVGRIDTVKGSRETYEFFLEYKRRNPGPLKFVFVGEKISDMPTHPDVLFTGFVDEPTKRDALAGALALVQPSRFESFSIVLCESWVQSRPAIVHADCTVMLGQARRSGGAVPYRGFAEFEAAVDLLVGDPALADRMGAAGRRYVVDRYRWDAVLDGFERGAATAIERFSRRSPSSSGTGPQVQASRLKSPGPSTN
jgi:glycosyltransferase involved in cell wall biosynthesis